MRNVDPFAEYRKRQAREAAERKARERYGYEITSKDGYEGTVYNDDKELAREEAEILLGHSKFTLKRVKLQSSRNPKQNGVVYWVVDERDPENNFTEVKTLHAAEKIAAQLNRAAGYERYSVIGYGVEENSLKQSNPKPKKWVIIEAVTRHTERDLELDLLRWRHTAKEFGLNPDHVTSEIVKKGPHYGEISYRILISPELDQLTEEYDELP